MPRLAAELINAPELGSPSGFTHAVRTGDVVRLSGQTALDEAGTIVSGGIVEQFRRALSNSLASLAAAGGGPEHLVDVTIYLLDIPDYRAHGREIGAVWRELVGPDYPAMTGVGVTALWQPEALVEIQATAVVPRG